MITLTLRNQGKRGINVYGDLTGDLKSGRQHKTGRSKQATGRCSGFTLLFDARIFNAVNKFDESSSGGARCCKGLR
jgi:hypothetical protein